MAEGFFGKFRSQRRISSHQVATDHRHLDTEFPVAFFFGGGLFDGIVIGAFLAVGAGPFQGAGIFLFIIDSALDSAEDFHFIHRFAAHAEIFLEKFGIHDRTGDPHRHAADRQVRFAAHGTGGHGGAGEAQNLLRHIVRNGGVGGILNVASVNSERRQPFLRMSGQNRRQIHRAGALGAVETPDRFQGHRVHVHRFGTVTPTGGNGQRGADVFAGELVGAGGGFGHAPDGGAGDHAPDRRTVQIAELAADQFGGGFGHVHGLDFQRFAHAAAAAVNGGANTDCRHGTTITGNSIFFV